MLTEYIQTAMQKAIYEVLEDDGTYYGEIPGLQGVYANADTLEECQKELESVLGDWILYRTHRHFPIPVLDRIDLTVREPA